MKHFCDIIYLYRVASQTSQKYLMKDDINIIIYHYLVSSIFLVVVGKYEFQFMSSVSVFRFDVLSSFITVRGRELGNKSRTRGFQMSESD